MKSKRHLKIIQIIKNNDISTQEELANLLQNDKIDVTQATVSRDIKNLGLIKVPTETGGYKYAMPPERERITMLGWVRRMFRDFVVDIGISDNIMVIKTLPGTSSGLASAIDNMEWQEVLGTIAGDDTIFIVLRDKSKSDELFNRLKDLIGLE